MGLETSLDHFAQWLPKDRESDPTPIEVWNAAWTSRQQLDIRVCEQTLCTRPDDHAANYFDGGLRFCARKIGETP